MFPTIKSNYKPLQCATFWTFNKRNTGIVCKSLWYKQDNTLRTVLLYKNKALHGVLDGLFGVPGQFNKE